MARWLKALWCRHFHRSFHIGFSSCGKTEWTCFECETSWFEDDPRLPKSSQEGSDGQ